MALPTSLTSWYVPTERLYLVVCGNPNHSCVCGEFVQDLHCGYNAISSLSLDDTNTATLPSLSELYITGNKLTTLASITVFPNLEVLDVSSNALPFVDILRHCSTLVSLSDLTIRGNPLPLPAEYARCCFL